MAMSSGSKQTGRTPPFILVALILLVVILGYNYWMLSSSNKNLSGMNDKLARESKDGEEKRMVAEKDLEAIREEVQVVKTSFEQAKKSLQDKETELNNLRAEQAKIQDETSKCKESVTKCDADLQTEKKNGENLLVEKTKLEADLQAAKEVKAPVCNADACITPVRDVLSIVTKLVGTDNMSKALTDAKFDAVKLMEGIEKVDPPAANPPANTAG